MTVRILDTSNVRTERELHAALQSGLDLPDHYGANLNALWDCLTGWIETPTELHWKGFPELQRTLGPSADELMTMLREAENEVDGFTLRVD